MESIMNPDDITIANRYLADALTDAERNAYEERLVREPQTLRELEATARLKVGLEQLRDKGELEEALRANPLTRSPLTFALAAAVASLVIGVSLWSTHGSGSHNALLTSSIATMADESGKVLPLGLTQSLLRTRTTSYDATIILPTDRSAIQFRVLPELTRGAETFSATLARVKDDESAEPLGTLRKLHRDADGYIDIYADSARIAPGRYRVTVTDEANSANVDSFLIRAAARRTE
ncbi:MAG TPA: hypothetical protein VLW26_03180 [Steroidobacteraceae bacterium]|nr:hypothetical protein [Steroidobacteraceae bacterium]